MSILRGDQLMSIFKKRRRQNKINQFKLEIDDPDVNEGSNFLKLSLDENKFYVLQMLGNSRDIVFREIQIGKSVKAGIFYADGLVDTNSIQNFILEPLMLNIHYDEDRTISSAKNVLKILKDQVLTVGSI